MPSTITAMSSAATQRTDQTDKQAVAGQFSLRALLLVILVAAVLCAAAMPRVRLWPANLQIEFVVVCLSYLVITGTMFIASRLFLRRRLRTYGTLLLALPSEWYTKLSAMVMTIFLAWFIWMWFWLLDSDAQREIDFTGSGFRNPLWIIFMATFYSSWAWQAWLSPREIRERGIVWGSMFYGWESWSGFRWREGRSLKLVLQSKLSTVTANIPRWLELVFQATCASKSFRIPRSQRDRVDQILQERLPRLPDPTSTATTSLGTRE